MRWAYLFTPKSKVPTRTSLCVVFWRTVLLTPAYFLTVAWWLYWLGVYWNVTLRFIVGAAVGIVLSKVIIRGLTRYMRHRRVRVPSYRAARKKPVRSRIADSPLYQGFKAVKSKVCPLVEIE